MSQTIELGAASEITKLSLCSGFFELNANDAGPCLPAISSCNPGTIGCK